MKVVKILLVLASLIMGCDSDNGISPQPEVIIAPFTAKITGDINADLAQDRYNLRYTAHANSERLEMNFYATLFVDGSKDERMGLSFTYDNALPGVGTYPIAGTSGVSQFFSRVIYKFRDLTQDPAPELGRRFEARSGLLTITYADRTTIKGTFTLEAEKVAGEIRTSENRVEEPLRGERIIVTGAFHVNVFLH